jgi:hypothetical protein
MADRTESSRPTRGHGIVEASLITQVTRMSSAFAVSMIIDAFATISASVLPRYQRRHRVHL